MDTKEIMESIEFRWGFLIPPSDPLVDEGEEEPPIPCRVVKLDRGRLLLRVEERNEGIKIGDEVRLDVPNRLGLVSATCVVERIRSVPQGSALMSVLIVDMHFVQRRKLPRYACNYLCRFTVMRDDEGLEHVTNRPQALGRVSDISLGGLQLQHELRLPIGTRLYVELIMPEGNVKVTGTIKNARVDEQGQCAYGIQFDDLDRFIMAQIQRVVLRLERKERRERERERAALTELRRSYRREYVRGKRWSSRRR